MITEKVYTGTTWGYWFSPPFQTCYLLLLVVIRSQRYQYISPIVCVSKA